MNLWFNQPASLSPDRNRKRPIPIQTKWCPWQDLHLHGRRFELRASALGYTGDAIGAHGRICTDTSRVLSAPSLRWTTWANWYRVKDLHPQPPRSERGASASPKTSVCTARQAHQRIFSNFGRRNLATPHRNLFRWPRIRSSGVIVRCHECFEPFFCPAQRHRSRGCLSLKLRWLLYSISTNCWSRSQDAKKSFNQLLYPSIR